MYLEKLAYENVGPLKSVKINFSFSSNGNPKPVILVGENGTGKSTILSNIVDSFYEMSRKHFSNVTTFGENGGYNFYKTILPNEIHEGTSYMYSLLQYTSTESEESAPVYIFKSGKVTLDDIKKQNNISEGSISGKKRAMKSF